MEVSRSWPNRARPRVPAAWRSSIAVVLAVAGCSLPLRHGDSDGPGPIYGEVEIVYERTAADPAFVEQLRPAVRFPDHALLDQAASVDRWSVARLRIEYPHPEGAVDRGRATLRLCTRGAPVRPCADDELWAMDVSRHELDRLLADLSQAGFFAKQPSNPGSKGTAPLRVRIDRRHVEKAWRQQACLDDCILRVYREGSLDGFVCATETEILPAGGMATFDEVGDRAPPRSDAPPPRGLRTRLKERIAPAFNSPNS